MSVSHLPLKVKKFEKIGTLVDVNGHKYVRDIGCSSTLRGVPFWLFGDTFPFNSRGQMIGLLTSTGAMGNPVDPVKSKYLEVDGEGRPKQFIPFIEEEYRFNKEHVSGGQKRYLIWSFSPIVEVEPGEGWIFFYKGRTQSQNLADNLDFGVDVARVSMTPDREVTVSRPLNKSLFDKDEVQWGSWDALVVDQFIYMYGTQAGHVYVARVPKVNPLNKSAYEYWGNGKWSRDSSSKTGLFWRLQSGSVFWSKFYKSFIMVGCTMWADNKIIMRSAPRPEGPWTNDTLLKQLDPPAKGFNYCMNAHPWAFPDSNGGELLVSWSDQGSGFVELAKVTWEGYQGAYSNPPGHVGGPSVGQPPSFVSHPYAGYAYPQPPPTQYNYSQQQNYYQQPPPQQFYSPPPPPAPGAQYNSEHLSGHINSQQSGGQASGGPTPPSVPFWSKPFWKKFG
ncbi:hypothetical protein V1514DRAFT_331430 [Lipomyces japonicus]|uniref:uncharacterized protein n=1 Tax=Lipomyces japonicus TaxID=56871 RepID=UPI0034CFDB41